jgi:AraC-like DNA-binding protein/quercetin dioxygenase-like cupin family protein
MLNLAWRRLDREAGDQEVMLRRVFYPSGHAFPFHRHDFFELVQVISGSGFHDTAGGSAAITAGDVVAVRPELLHRCRAGRGALVFINLVIAPALARAVSDALAKVPGWDAPGPPPVLRPRDLDAASLSDHLADLERPGGAADRLAATALVTDLAWRAARARRMDHAPRAGAWAKMQVKLLAALDDPLVLAEGASGLAERVGCSREHLTRLARRQLGRPLATLIAERRLEVAASLLRQGDAEVTAVCLASGHHNLGHFYTRFRRRFGCTPLAYRGRARDAAAPA